MNNSSLAMGLCATLFIIIAISLLLIALKFSRRRYQSLRSAMILSFGAPTSMMLMMWYVVLKNPAGVAVFYSLGFLFGLGGGILCIRSIKKMIVGDTLNAAQYFRCNFSFQESLANWRETLLVIIGGAVGFFTVTYARDAALALFPGFFSGISVYGFVWVCLYERRHGIQIKFKHTDPAEEMGSDLHI